MKTFIAIFISLICMLIMNSAQAATSYTYEVKTGDVGTIRTAAKDKPAAFRKAGNECFDRRIALYEAKRGAISEERMLDIAESCTNLKW